MKFTLFYKPHFLRRLHAMLKKNRSLQQRIDKTLRQLETNPLHTGLHTHKVIRRDGDPAFASRVTGDLRILWEFNGEHTHVLDLLDLGGHEGVGKCIGNVRQ